MNMKRVIAFLLLSTIAMFASAKDVKFLNSYISYAAFNVTGDEPSQYVETYITFDKSSLVYSQNIDKDFTATINVTILFKEGETIKNFGKYTVESPAVNDTANIDGFFMDVQRYSLPNGTYTMEVVLEDVNNKTEKPFKVEDQIIVDFPETFCISSIIGLESFTKSEKLSNITKNGYELIPMIVPFYPETANKLSFYAEIYNSDKLLGDSEKYLLNTYICAFENGSKLNNYYFTKRMNAKGTEVIINSIDITNLPSGNYYLVLEARDRNNDIIGLNRYFFQRSNPNYIIDPSSLSSIDTENVFSGQIANIDTIRKYIRTLTPISTQVEKEYSAELIKTDDLKIMQQYFFTFWASRNSVEPRKAWEDYYAQVKRVNASFKSINNEGFATDRGRVFLKYGAPDRIVQSYNEPGAYPYEIWHYYTLGSQRNKKFVFMTMDIATNDFQLIHSDAVGELSNFRWTTEIYKRTYGTYYDYGVDQYAVPDSYGDHAKDYYDNPR
ncbi:MAG: GWxTD domain-containing protein [Candidatus Limimorpha sp.]